MGYWRCCQVDKKAVRVGVVETQAALNLLSPARLSSQSRFFIAFGLAEKLRPYQNAAILATNPNALETV
jgi:hypothetical protein